MQAGVALPQAFEKAGGIPRRERQRLVDPLHAGESVDAVLRRAPRWFPEVDRHVLGGAARSGKMSETLLVLSKQRQFMAKQSGRALGAMVYPLFVMHFALLALVVYVFFATEDPASFLGMMVPFVLLFWAGLIFLFWSVRSRHRWVGSVMRFIPLLRGHAKNQAVADLCFALGGYLTAGETIDVAWAGAADACGDRRLRRLAESVAEQARLGTPPSSRIDGSRILPEDFVSLYQAGELSGQLEENLYHLWQIYSERASQKLSSASFWYPKLLMIGVAVAVAYVVVRAYAAYLDSVMEML